MNVLRTGMNMSISHIHIWICYNMTKQSDAEIPVKLELWRMRSIPLLPSLPGPPWPGVETSDRVLFMGSTKTKRCAYAKLHFLK